MQFDWILSPITEYTIMGVGFAAALSLWIGAQIELRDLRAAVTSFKQAGEDGLGVVRARLDELASVKPPDPVPAAPPSPNCLNLTKRTQALRMYRRGEPVASIAAALETPLSEVALLLKLNRILEKDNAQ